MAEQTMPAGSLVDALGAQMTMEDGDLATEVVIVARVLTADGRSVVRVSHTTGADWVVRLGMLHAAVAVDTPTGFPGPRTA